VSFISALRDVIPGDSRVLPSNVDGPAGSLMIIQALRSVGWLHTPPGPTWVMVGDDPSPDDPSPDGSPADARLASLDGPLWSTARRQVG
jgi:hypothetical protein